MSGMVTNLDMQDKVVIGGEEIAVFKWQLQNQHLQQFCHVISRLQLAILECDSNNSTGQMIPHDAKAVAKDWQRAKFEWDKAVKWRHLSPAAQEKILSVLAITDNEQLRTVNVKCRRVVAALSTLIQKVVFCDSAKLQYGIGSTDIEQIGEHIEYVGEVLADYIGDGSGGEDGYNVGMDVPAHEHLGTIKPPVNLHEAQVQEPSPAAPQVPTADAPDTPSSVPKPGSNTRPSGRGDRS